MYKRRHINRVYVKSTANFIQAITDRDMVHLFRKFKIKMKRQKPALSELTSLGKSSTFMAS